MHIVTKPQNRENHRRYIAVCSRITSFLDGHGFARLDLPVLVPALIPESYLEVFETEYRFLEERQKLYLTPSPELHIKRLLADGIGNCYYLGKSFRNSEPMSSKHSGEFTMLELYQVDASYMEIADLVLDMLQDLAVESSPSGQSHIVTYQGMRVDLSRWEKLTVAEAFNRYANIDESTLFDHKAFLRTAREKGYVVESATQNAPFSYEELWSQIYTNEVEPHLGKNGFPTLLYDYPVEFAALSKPNPDGKTAQRFEFYIAGVELGNCYSELTDVDLQRERLDFERQERQKSGKIDHTPDEGFLDVLKNGLPSCAGIAIGVERLAMVFTDVATIHDLKLIQILE